MVQNGRRISSAVRRIENESAVPAASGVLMTIAIFARLHQIDNVRTALVDLVDVGARDAQALDVARGAARRDQLEADLSKAARDRLEPRLSSSRTLTKTVPLERQIGRRPRAGPWRTRREVAVDAHHLAGRFHLGTEQRVDAGELANGNTDSFTEMWAGTISSVKPSSASFWPAITRAASFASGTPIALLTNGTVREARGFTSRM